MHPDSKRANGQEVGPKCRNTTCCGALFNVLRATCNVLRPYSGSGGRHTSMCCTTLRIIRRVARIPTRYQKHAVCRNTATLLSLKTFYNNCRYIRTYMCMYIGKKNRTAFEVLRPPLSDPFPPVELGRLGVVS